MHTSTAVMKLIIVYTIVAIKKFKLLITNVTIKKIAKIIAETKGGHFKIFCNAIETIIVAIGKAKNISKSTFIFISPLFFTIFYALQLYLVNITI
jgi:hypothetical protein